MSDYANDFTHKQRGGGGEHTTLETVDRGENYAHEEVVGRFKFDLLVKDTTPSEYIKGVKGYQRYVILAAWVG